MAKKSRKKFPNFFFILLESSETYADSSLNEIGDKLHFPSKNLQVPET